MQQYLAEILDNREVSTGYFRMRFSAPVGAAPAPRAGQFVHVMPGPVSKTGQDPLLRRAFSVLQTDSESWQILFRSGGRGTRALAALGFGDKLDVLGPLGQPYEVRDGRLILIGGGVGVPPMAMMARQLVEQGRGGDVTVIIGGRNMQDVLCQDDFFDCGVPTQVTTDDGSCGRQGRVTDMLEELLSADPAETFHVKHTVYACGPIPMLRAVSRLCAEHEVPCQVSLEENMPCGIGVCNGCVVPTHTGDGSDAGKGSDDGNDSVYEFARYRRVCVDGPAFWGTAINWEVF